MYFTLYFKQAVNITAKVHIQSLAFLLHTVDSVHLNLWGNILSLISERAKYISLSLCSAIQVAERRYYDFYEKY